MKFKFGDRVRFKDPDHAGDPGSRHGAYYKIVGEVATGLVRAEPEDSSLKPIEVYPGRFSLEERASDPDASVLEELVKKVNEGIAAWNKINDKGALQHSSLANGRGDKPPTNGFLSFSSADISNGMFYRVKPKATFEPFNVGPWRVELNGDLFCIGCKNFNASDFAKRFKGGEDNIVPPITDSGTRFIRGTRTGIHFEFQGNEKHFLRYEDLDKILAALEKAGIKG